jgi:hypothetical protein
LASLGRGLDELKAVEVAIPLRERPDEPSSVYMLFPPPLRLIWEQIQRLFNGDYSTDQVAIFPGYESMI